MKPRGAPEVVYSKDGVPLVAPIEAGVEELRNLVGAPGRYRLDAVDDNGRTVEDLPAAYVIVPARNEAAASPAAPAPMTFDGSAMVVAEAMRASMELAKSVVDRFGQVMEASAELLRAADGAGLPRREPRVVVETEDDEDEDDVIEAPAAPSSPAFDLLNTLVAQIVPIVVSGIASKGLPKLDGVLDWRKAAANAGTKAPVAPSATHDDGRAEDDHDAAGQASSESALPPLGPQQMAHFLAIQSSLKPDEAALARQLAAELTPAEMRAWLAELSAMSVPDAVAKIRTLVAGQTKAGGAS
jgi:hypothetical protein